MRRAGTGDPSLGLFLMGLWSAAMLLFTWDQASASTWDGFAGVHLVMQAILLLAALGAGGTGAALWMGSAPRPTTA